MKGLLFTFVLATLLRATPSSWLDPVGPIITPDERKHYLALPADGREKFEQEFWATKSITAEEYYRRLQYIDSTFGSTKVASGANSDPGRVYLSLGPPNRITRIPSSRIFVPMEIWYYESVPEANLNTELRLIFYQKNALGLPKLYSPTLDTLRALLLPEAGTVGMFGPNDSLSEATIRQNLNLGPAEDEVISAASTVAAGISSTGNDEILGEITSPQLMLTRAQRYAVSSKLILAHPKLDVVQTASSFGGTQVDLKVTADAKSDIGVQVTKGSLLLYESRLNLRFAKVMPIQYLHRLDLLPGRYTVTFLFDGKIYRYPLDTTDRPKSNEMIRVRRQVVEGDRKAPFEFDGAQFVPDPEGDFLLLPLSRPGESIWSVRRGFQVLWKTKFEANTVALLQLPLVELSPGTYRLESTSPDGDQSTDLTIRQSTANTPTSTILSYNANLAPSSRYASIGHQWLVGGNIVEARKSLQSSLDSGITSAAEIELARADALCGELDAARSRVRDVLTKNPRDFEALSVFAYIEIRFQDYAVAADLYHRALAVQDSPAVREALAHLPVK